MKENILPLSNLVWRPQQQISTVKSTFKFKQVSASLVEKYLQTLKIKKSTGLDNIPAKLLKDSAKYIANPLCFLINLSLKTGTFPTKWKSAKVLAIYKSGSQSDLGNYRPISILPTLSKIIEKIVHEQMSDYLQKNDLLSSSQFGFRTKRSTELAVTLFTDDIRLDAR